MRRWLALALALATPALAPLLATLALAPLPAALALAPLPAALALASLPAWAESGASAPPAPHDTPFLYDRQAGMGITSSALGRGFTQDVRLRFTEPFAAGRVSLRVETPMVYARVEGGRAAGIGPDADTGGGTGAPGMRRSLAAGDVSFRLSGLAYSDATRAVQGLLDLSVPTGTADTGAARFIASPAMSGIWLNSRHWGLAGQVRQSLSFGGAASAARINLTELDAFLFWRVIPGQAWLTFNPTQRLDFAGRRFSGGTFRVTGGWRLGEVAGGGLSIYVRPGIGIGRDRPYDWNLEAGLTLSAF